MCLLFFIFHKKTPQKLWKILLISSKLLFVSWDVNFFKNMFFITLFLPRAVVWTSLFKVTSISHQQYPFHAMQQTISNVKIFPVILSHMKWISVWTGKQVPEWKTYSYQNVTLFLGWSINNARDIIRVYLLCSKQSETMVYKYTSSKINKFFHNFKNEIMFWQKF